MGALYAGLDGGGTKTAVRLLDESGHEAAAFRAAGINYTASPGEAVQAALADIFGQLFERCGGADDLAAVCICAAGVSRPDVPARLLAAVRACGYTGPVRIEGDQVGAMAGALESTSGAILLSGTGSICYGRALQNGRLREMRTGGWGHIIGDEGSGYAIGRDILHEISRAQDGRTPPTLLAAPAYAALGVRDFSGILAFVYGGAEKKQIAALAPLLDEACAQGDDAALRIAQNAGEELALLAAPVLTELQLTQETLALAGSILEKSEPVRAFAQMALRERFPALSFTSPRRDAAYGAALLAMERP